MDGNKTAHASAARERGGSSENTSLPDLALSVRQPWAWAIIHGGKVIENRTKGAVRTGGMTCRRIAIHSASAMTRAEYEWGLDRLARHGVTCPRPEALIRRALIGAVDVVDIVTESDSPWFGGPCGLVLENPVACAPVPATGHLGYFAWQRSGAVCVPAPWMARFDRTTADADAPSLFPDAPAAFAEQRARPSRMRKRPRTDT